ncbi:esterase/lipase [Pyrenophora tritici-repentis]|uniref:Esterase/lipase n=2 Tax=Pyrenophora tritici-repentis TaxID=45151 RepID=A0A316ZN09_9PLEO|nr:esterase/lipase [Pyrenophora tritici-repentis Pt-1C-BFP]KAA8611290.1 esterase/lipase [Pyrenophora tritici-repentis]EDU42300.1 esterase/lipase [Pyrenophora tritici-repentis Pt-1C-BFP]KAF7442096.1 esterase/lipase [Pyrenophora tritici-repentis]KAI0569157.1 esterase/lipase [Pyrenophora tritici-repentis]KAI1508196.1 esterase/lipase [Pyrenophora tritici-repentis]
MVLNIDQEFLAAVSPMLGTLAGVQKPGLHDVKGRREFFARMNSNRNPQVAKGVELKIYHIPTPDGYQLPIYHFRVHPKEEATKNPAVFHIHGGGLISISAADVVDGVSEQVLLTGVQVFSVDYRLAPENPYPTPLEDCWTGLTWMFAQAEKFNLDTTSIAVMGESAGGNLSAALTLLARDRQMTPPFSRQILIYPMLDDRNTLKAIGQIPIWDEIDNLTGWTAYLGREPGGSDVPMFAAPARVENVDGLPPLYIEVSQLDLYLFEDLEYASKFLRAGIETELHVYPGVPHGFDGVAPSHTMSKLAKENRLRVIRKLYRSSDN